MWESLFRLACLLKRKPTAESVYHQIIHVVAETEDGSFSGSFDEQICVARAELAVYEHRIDRMILKRIFLWLCYAEKEFVHAVCGSPERKGDSVKITMAGTHVWLMKGKDLSDISAMQAVSGEPVTTTMIPYAGSGKRITVFPREKNACLK